VFLRSAEPPLGSLRAPPSHRAGSKSDPHGAAIAEAAARSGADAVLADLPDGPRTLLTTAFQSGRDLSGGQWQRIEHGGHEELMDRAGTYHQLFSL
jgi:ATP-binding cassette, subfamily B, bacterial